MTIDQLKRKLSKYGTIATVKDGYVFTLLIKCDKLFTLLQTTEVLNICAEYCGDRFPAIEVLISEEKFWLAVSKPSSLSYINLSGHSDLLEYVKEKLWNRHIPAAGTPEEFVHRFLSVCASQVYEAPRENGFTPWKRLLKAWLLTEYGEMGVPEDLKDF